eukprot:TRINITY_DN17709_c0_g1_i1.p1 TRINITY_DN17709_c0_g1~~TRINITY_DN17709_c0_g1_i1.p1  ORF type:complete len:124 (+),score=8.91 TRINITY_DN17709_c0_g1_i1:112-483(+)
MQFRRRVWALPSQQKSLDIYQRDGGSGSRRKKLVICDLLNIEPVQGLFEIDQCECVEGKTIFGNNVQAKIGKWNTQKYDFKLLLKYKIFRKKRRYIKTSYQEYMKADQNPYVQSTKELDDASG